jgi:glucose/mannose transport system permease protein
LGDPNYSSLDLENYIIAFQGGVPSWSELTVSPIWNSAWNTVVLMVSFSVVCLIVGLLLAILVDQQIRFENTFRTIYLLPMSLSFVVTAKFWLYMYNPETGLINIAVQSLGFQPVQIVQNPDLKLAAVAFALIWQFSGYAMVVYLAGLRAIPTSHFEAARVDGAPRWAIFRHITLPGIKYMLAIAVVFRLMRSFRSFDIIWLVTQGGPGTATEILNVYLYRMAFVFLQGGEAAAIGLILLVITIVTTMGLLRAVGVQ